MEVHIVVWPSAADYQAAMQNVRFCLSDPELKNGIPETDKLGLPKPISGNFAVVFPMSCNKNKWAVRCFFKQQNDREQRYELISKYLNKVKLPYMVDFEFIRQGVQVNRNWFPIIKMQWVDGELLDRYIQRNLNNPKKLENLANEFLMMMSILKQNQIAHGDLQHRNIIIVNDHIRLVDYDGMFVPGLEQWPCRELGHNNYQSPYRNELHFGYYLDNFSAWVIYISLLVLSIDPTAWRLNQGDDECIILRKDDFRAPEFSTTFSSLEKINDNSFQNTLTILKSVLINQLDVPDIPFLDPKLHPVSIPIKPRVITNTESPWLEELIIPSHTINQSTKGKGVLLPLPNWLHDYVPTVSVSVPLIRITKSMVIERIVVMCCFGLLGLLTWFGTAGFLNAYAALLLSLSLIVSLPFFFHIRFSSGTELMTKRTLEREFRDIETKLSLAQRAQVLINEGENSILANERSKVIDLQSQWRESNEKAQDELNTINQVLQGQLAQIQTRRQRLNLTNQKDSYLKEIQGTFLTNRLMQSRINTANISGIGDNLKKQLALVGVKTAADFIDINITTSSIYFGHQTQVAHIVMATGSKVHVTGIGPQKAKALLLWRKDTKSRIEKELPLSLSTVHIQSLETEIRSKVNQLGIQETQVRQEYDTKKKQIVSQCFQKHVEIKNQILIIHKRIENELRESQIIVEENHLLLGELEHVFKAKQHELLAYKEINLAEYIRRIFTL